MVTVIMSEKSTKVKEKSKNHSERDGGDDFYQEFFKIVKELYAPFSTEINEADLDFNEVVQYIARLSCYLSFNKQEEFLNDVYENFRKSEPKSVIANLGEFVESYKISLFESEKPHKKIYYNDFPVFSNSEFDIKRFSELSPEYGMAKGPNILPKKTKDQTEASEGLNFNYEKFFLIRKHDIKRICELNSKAGLIRGPDAIRKETERQMYV